LLNNLFVADTSKIVTS